MTMTGGDVSATSAVLAHTLLTPLAKIMAAAAILHDHWPTLSEHERTSLIEKIEGHAVLLEPVLRGIAQGLDVKSGSLDTIR